MAIKSSKSGVRKGDVICGQYEVMSLIGEGGMSRVFLASDRRLANKLWAVKEVDRRATDPAGRPIEASLAMEAELLSKVDHPNIVDIVNIEKTEDFIYVVMDYVEGQSLDHVVRTEGPQSEEDVQRWMLQICDALDCLHRQDPPIVYRDMKPNNIMLHPDGYVKLIDFGVSREYKDEEKKDTIAFGTTGYAAPEQYGKAQSDARTDIYGMGATMWHLLGGEAPPAEFPLPNVHTVNPDVSEGFADVIIPKCTAVDRNERYQNCAELAADLDIYEELNEDFRSAQRKKVMAFAVTGALAVLFLILGFALLFINDVQVQGTYEGHMEKAQNALSDVKANAGTSASQDDYNTAVDEYRAAIETKPSEMAAWEGLIDTYEADAEFDVNEKKQFDEVYNRYQNDPQLDAIKSELAYEIGRMYLYFYSYGQSDDQADGDNFFQNSASNQTARIKASSSYFNTAADDDGFSERNTAHIYSQIASFVSNLENEIQKGGESSDMYQQYFNSLKELLPLTDQEKVELARYNTYLLIANSLENYVNQFRQVDGITQSDVETLWEETLDAMANDPATTDTTKAIEEAIQAKSKSISDKIHTAYSRLTFSGGSNSGSGSE